MNRDDIIRMAREAGWTGIYSEWSSPTERTSIEVPVTMEQIERFAALVAAAEREECAKVCDEQEKRSRESSEKARRERDQFMYHHCAVTAKWNAAAIRARGQE